MDTSTRAGALAEAIVALEVCRRCSALQCIAENVCPTPRCDAVTSAAMVDTERAMRAVKQRCVVSPDTTYRQVAESLSGAVQEFLDVSRAHARRNDAIHQHHVPHRSRHKLYERAYPYILGQAIDVEIVPSPVAIARLDDGSVRVTAAGAIEAYKVLTCMPTHRLFLKQCKSAPWTSRKCVASLGGSRDAYEEELCGLDRNADILYCSDPSIFREGSCTHLFRKSSDARHINACILTFLGGVARVAVSIRRIQPGELLCVYRDDARPTAECGAASRGRRSSAGGGP